MAFCRGATLVGWYAWNDWFLMAGAVYLCVFATTTVLILFILIILTFINFTSDHSNSNTILGPPIDRRHQ